MRDIGSANPNTAPRKISRRATRLADIPDYTNKPRHISRYARGSETKQRRQSGKRADFALRLAGETLVRLIIAVAPDRAHSECRGGVGVPAVRRDEDDRAFRYGEAIDHKPID